MNYEKKYKEALEIAQKLYQDCPNGKNDRLYHTTDLEKMFPELRESEDEKIRKELIEHIKDQQSSFISAPDCRDKYEEEENNKYNSWLAWLEKQNTERKQLYIRFGDIPSNEKSKIYRGEDEIGDENGVSVYPAFKDKEGNIILGLNLPITKTSLHTQQHLLEYDNRPCYLVSGDYVGKGTDGEPLIKNVKIIKEIKPYRIKQDKENNIYVINNTTNCGVSVYNEELKESEDERIRKDLMKWFEEFPDMIWRGHYKKDVVAWLEKQGSEENKGNLGGISSIKEALRTEYEKGRADAIQATEQWLANSWPKYCENPNIIYDYKEAIK